MALTVTELDEVIDALVLGAQSFTLPDGRTVQRAALADLMKLRDSRKDEADAGIGIAAIEVDL